jgi:hypothetical protein
MTPYMNMDSYRNAVWTFKVLLGLQVLLFKLLLLWCELALLHPPG